MILDAPILILNKHWAAIGTTTVRQAFALLCRQAARVICPHSYEIYDLGSWLFRSLERSGEIDPSRLVQTPRVAIEAPEVILLSAYGGIPRTEVAFSRRNLYRRDGYSCQYCSHSQPASNLSIDHVLPRSRGGRTTWENCVLACVRCNTRKGDRTPKECGLRLARLPRRPTWSPLLETLPRLRPQSWANFLREAC